MTDRIERARALMHNQGIDLLAMVPGATMRYLTGLAFSTKLRLTIALIPATGTPVLVIPALEIERARAQIAPGFAVLPWHDSDGPAHAMQQAAHLTNLADRQIGIEPAVMRVFELRQLEAIAQPAQIADASSLFATMRMVKDSHELAAMREAVRLIEATLHTTLASTHAGLTEREVAQLWGQAVQATGCELAFDLAVGSGPNGANPHHQNGDRKLQAGDLVVLDGGLFYAGYASDITRTIAIGEPDSEARRVYDLVYQANAAGRAACRPATTGAAIDAAARAVIEAGGYGAAFIHRTGHGLGMEIHEPPFIVAGSTQPLLAGMTFTVEPGIYLAGRCGVRIEDDMLLTDDGAESLTSFQRELMVL